jgi:hypothetical protein
MPTFHGSFNLPFTFSFRDMTFSTRTILGTAALAALALSPATLQAQESTPRPPAPKVLVAGENPAIRLLDKEGGKAISSANFWRVEWSPAGAGAVCFVTVNAPGEDGLRIAIYDDKTVLDYVTTDLMSSLMKTFNDPAYTPVKGTITQTNNGATDRKETCKSDRYTVELVWKGLGQGSWADMKMGPVLMTFTMVPASSGEIWINGKRAPGTWYPTGGGMGPGAYLTVNETWRR